MALVAICMVAILGMAVLSIDAVTLYLAREEAQRAADAAALAGARILSLSGMTGDPTNATGSWPNACSAATTVATAVAQQNQIAGLSLPNAQITVTFPNNTACGTASVFGVNPEIAVKVSRQNLPTFFDRYWNKGTNTVTATATAEAYNPSNSATFNQGAAGGIIPVQPRCVKPWIVPNKDPGNSGVAFVDLATGNINNQGVNQLNAGSGVIGEQFILTSPCKVGAANCDFTLGNLNHQPNDVTGTSLDYVPAQTQPSPYTAVNSSCPNGDDFQMAIAGCDQKTQYNCGTAGGANIDLDIGPVNPGVYSGETVAAAQCMINGGTGGGQDSLHPGAVGSPIYPFQIWAGLNNPLVKSGIVNDNDPITSSSSIVSVPIYDSTTVISSNNQAVTIVGFLQVFIIDFPGAGDPRVTVLNVAGCSKAATNAAVTGTSPVPIRLITPP